VAALVDAGAAGVAGEAGIAGKLYVGNDGISNDGISNDGIENPENIWLKSGGGVGL